MKSIPHFTMVIMIISFFTSSCGKSESNSSELEKIIPISEIKIRSSSSGHPWKKSYSNALGNLLSDSYFDSFLDVKIEEVDLRLAGCLNFNELTDQEKRVFYIAFLAAISEAESDFEVDQKTYNRADQTMNIGMLQIDRASANRHGSYYFNRKFNDFDLENPELNLMIGALILKNQILKGATAERLFPDRTYYWQVLSGSKKRVLRNLQSSLSNSGICRN